MICKWCGETVKPGSVTCRRCKREIPALSDCGGFYDLVPMEPATAPSEPMPQTAVQPPVRPVLPERKKSRPITDMICGVAVVLALIFMILTVSLSGKLADAKEEADRLRGQNGPVADITASQPSDPLINGLEDQVPGPIEEPEQVKIKLKDGAGEIKLNKAQNAQLNEGTLHFCVRPDGAEDAALTFTLQRQTTKDETEAIFLQITGSEGIEIQSIVWHNDELVEIPEDEQKQSILDYIFPSSDNVTEFIQPIDALGEGKSICTLAGEDESGETVIITIRDIVIE